MSNHYISPSLRGTRILAHGACGSSDYCLESDPFLLFFSHFLKEELVKLAYYNPTLAATRETIPARKYRGREVSATNGATLSIHFSASIAQVFPTLYSSLTLARCIVDNNQKVEGPIAGYKSSQILEQIVAIAGRGALRKAPVAGEVSQLEEAWKRRYLEVVHGDAEWTKAKARAAASAAKREKRAKIYGPLRHARRLEQIQRERQVERARSISKNWSQLSWWIRAREVRRAKTIRVKKVAEGWVRPRRLTVEEKAARTKNAQSRRDKAAAKAKAAAVLASRNATASPETSATASNQASSSKEPLVCPVPPSTTPPVKARSTVPKPLASTKPAKTSKPATNKSTPPAKATK